MNNKITFTELAALLSLRTSLDSKLCEKFLRQYASTVSETLISGESVKIKGFGTFKITEVEARKSVNVVSGENFEIPPHKKISFVPANELAQAVNAPFEAFEAIELSDQESDSIADESFPSILPEEEPAAVQAEFTESEPEIDEIDSQDIPDQIQSPGQKEIEDSSYIFVNDTEESEPEEEVDKNRDIPIVAADTDEVNFNPETTSEKINNDTAQDSADQTATIIAQTNSCLRPHRFLKGFLLGLLTGIIVCILAFTATYMIIEYQLTKPEPIHHTDSAEKGKTAPVQQAVTEPVDTKAVESRQSESISVPTEPSDEPAALNNDPVYDTITKTRYLTTMAKEHYGNYHLWPYIYEENKSILGHPDRIRPGTRVRIPSLEKYGIDPKNPDDIAKAKKKGVQIYAKWSK